jgi:hypothetical protein
MALIVFQLERKLRLTTSHFEFLVLDINLDSFRDNKGMMENEYCY